MGEVGGGVKDTGPLLARHRAAAGGELDVGRAGTLLAQRLGSTQGALRRGGVDASEAVCLTVVGRDVVHQSQEVVGQALGGRRVEHDDAPVTAGRARRRVDQRRGHLEVDDEDRSRRCLRHLVGHPLALLGPRLVRDEGEHDRLVAVGGDEDRRQPAGSRRPANPGEVDAGPPRAVEGLVGQVVLAHATEQAHGSAQPAGEDGDVGFLPTRRSEEVARQARPRPRRGGMDALLEVSVDAAQGDDHAEVPCSSDSERGQSWFRAMAWASSCFDMLDRPETPSSAARS